MGSLLVAGAVAFGAVVVSAGPATAWHYYSTATEQSDTNHYTGVELYRPDGVYTIPSCTASTPIYQPVWVIMNGAYADGEQWLEVGTGHRCSGQPRYWYFGYAMSGVGSWTWEYTRDFSTTSSHVFRIRRKSSTDYRWDVCLDPASALGWNCRTYDWGNSNAGRRVETGLESYASGATAPTVISTNQHYTVFDGAWQNWAGPSSDRGDYCEAHASPCAYSGTTQMYGRWNGNATTWRYSQNSTLG